MIEKFLVGLSKKFSWVEELDKTFKPCYNITMNIGKLRQGNEDFLW